MKTYTKIKEADPQKAVSWAEVAKSIEGRTAKQCRERWMNHLDPNVNKGYSTPFPSDCLALGRMKKMNSCWNYKQDGATVGLLSLLYAFLLFGDGHRT